MNSTLVVAAAIVSLAAITACSSTSKTTAPKAAAARVLPTSLEEAVASTSYRTTENTARDKYRHPVETLNFFGIKPSMTVVEISPGNGWYAEILAPYLAPAGHYIAALPVPSPENKMATDMYTKVVDWLKERPELMKSSTLTAFSPPSKVEVAPEGSADMVLTFRNVHNWMSQGAEQAAFNGFFKALKHGGTLGVVEHRANGKTKHDSKAKSGYVSEKDVMKIAKKAGFKFEASSELNANSKDTKNYPEGVWTLPPTLRLKEKDQAKYLEIGESDRMTLKFVKP
ncbi:class I SAM-dependent methyltransferase [soil metagenome]